MIERLSRLLFTITVVLATGLYGGTATRGAGFARANLHLFVKSDPRTLMPLSATTRDESEIARLLFDPLFEYDENNQLVPVLASNIPTRRNGGISADGRTITIALRRNVRWHDGARFTSSDVVYTIHAILEEKNNVANRGLYKTIDHVEALDAYSVRFHLLKPQSSFFANVGSGYPIIPEHLLRGDASLGSDDLNRTPIGTGPYRFERWVHGDHVEFASNENYFLGSPKIAHITLSVVPDSNTLSIKLRRHEIDFASVESSTFELLRDVPGLLRSTEPRNSVVMLALNSHRPALGDVRVRRAIIKAIDRKRLVQVISHGTGTVAYGDMPLFMYDGHPPSKWDEADPAGAKLLLAAAGWVVGPDGIRSKAGVPLHLMFIDVSGSASGASADLEIIQMLRDVGIDAEYKTFSPSIYFEPASAGGPLFSGNFDIAATGFVGGPDATDSELFGCASRIPHGYNAANYCSTAMERLQAAEQQEYDPVRRNRIVAQIEKLAVNDATYVFVYHTPFRLVYDSTLQRPKSSLTSPWYEIQKWSFSTP